MVSSFALGTFGALINTITCHILLVRRKPIWLCILLFIAVTAFIFSSILVLERVLGKAPLNNFVAFILAFVYIIYIYFVFEESFAKKLFTMMSILMFYALTTLMKTYVADSMIHGNQYTYPNDLIKLIFYILPLFVQLSAAIFVRKVYKQFIQIIDNRTVYFMNFFPIIAVLYLNDNYKRDPSTYNMSFDIGNILIFVLFVILGYINICIAILSITKTLKMNKDMKIIEGQLYLQRENYRSLLEFEEDRSKLKHDLRHHILTVKSMLESGNAEGSLNYVQQFNQSELMKDIPVLCENLAAGSLIKHYMSIALKKDIDFRTKLNIPEDININPIDLSVILGNCIENAVNACDKLSNGERKYIELKSNIVGQQLIISIKNSYNGIIKREGDAFISSSHDGPGIGISSIMAAVKKYKGNVDIKYNNNEFEVDMILPV